MILSWLGLILGVASILLGNALEGGHLDSLIQPTAAMIVFGGTVGATLLGATTKDFVNALKGLSSVFFGAGKADLDGTVNQLVELCKAARREGLVALDRYIPTITNPFFATHLRHVVDGYDPDVLKQMMEEEIELEEEEKISAAKVWESAGGFSPTIGILGAVLGLIHVMSNLSDSSKLGAGIAVAFVATVYGVGAANLILLPIANKLKKAASNAALENRLVYTGLLSLQSGLNPRIIEERLMGMLGKGSEAGANEAQIQKKAA